MLPIIKSKKVAQNSLSHSQKTFNRLRKKIGTLQLELKSSQNELDECLRFYQQNLQPKEQAVKEHLTSIVKILYGQYKKIPQRLSKQDCNSLKSMLSNMTARIIELSGIINNDPEIAAIILDLENIDYRQLMSDEFKEIKESLETMCKDNGMNVNLSDIHESNDENDMMRKIFEAMREARSQMQEEEVPEKPKSKKEMNRELKEKKLAALQKQDLNQIYKQLAKVIHPDLEQDPKLKNEKVELMKKLTVAYEDKDLHTLLVLELEWLNRSENTNERTEDQLKIYNSILKEQVKALELEFSIMLRSPKYYAIQQFLQHDVPFFVLNITHKEIKYELGYVEDLLRKLQNEDLIKTIRMLIK